MSVKRWRQVTWVYHILFAFAVTWPGQALVNDPFPLILHLPRQIVWAAAWIIGSIFVLWRLDRAEAPLRTKNRPVEGGALDG
ncbi:MAG: hypothetical protein ACR2QM_00190 [Longimicrobiales bacterium]